MDKEYIKSVIQSILNKEFTDPTRRKIVEYDNRLNFCAPCCGDSHKNKHAKRGNLYFSKLLYICFNCNKKTTFDRLAKEFSEPLDPQKKLEIIDYLNSCVDYTDYEDNLVDSNLEDLIDIKDLERAFNVDKISPIYDFRPIKKNSGYYKYLLNRGIPESLHKDIWSAKYSKGDEGYESILVLLNRRGDKVLGLQVRNLKSGRKRFFVIYNWEHLCRWTNGEETDIDIAKSVVYNKLSYFFNILNVNFDSKITIFEGFLDSLFFPNSIGMVGVNTDDKFLKSNNLDIQYFYDNDEAGFKKSIEKIKEGDSVFLWKKFLGEIVKRKKDTDPYKLEWRISKVKDLNKLAELSANPYKNFDLESYFSESVLDTFWIPKKERIVKKQEVDYNKEFKGKGW